MTDSSLLVRAGQLRSGRTPFVLATVVRAERPTSARPGDSALVLPDGTVEGFVGGACAESTTRAEGLRALRSGESSLVRITPDGVSDGGIRTVVNPCLSGGTLEIFFEAVVPPALVVVFGDAPVARALARVGEALEHEVRLAVDVATFTERLAPDTSAVVVASHGRDEVAVLAVALAAGVPYVALVASPRRAEGVLAELAASGVEGVERVHAPAGLDIGARTPGEIALSIYAQALVHGDRGRTGPGAGDGVTAGGTAAAAGRADLSAAAVAGSASRSEAASARGAVAEVPGPVTAADPVCGMTVATVAASLHVEHEGATVWFCGTGCRDAFLADPARYAR